MWAPGADSNGRSIDPTHYWPGASQVEHGRRRGLPRHLVGIAARHLLGLFGPVFGRIHTLTSLPIFIAETNLAPLDGTGYESIPGFISDLCSSGSTRTPRSTS